MFSRFSQQVFNGIQKPLHDGLSHAFANPFRDTLCDQLAETSTLFDDLLGLLRNLRQRDITLGLSNFFLGLFLLQQTVLLIKCGSDLLGDLGLQLLL